MRSVEERLTATLHDRAEGDVDVTALLTGASARGQRIRRRHRVAALAATAVGVVAVVGIATAVLPGSLPGGTPPGTGSTSDRGHQPPGWTVLPTPPVAGGLPTAAEDPSVVGADGGLLHLSFDKLPTSYATVQYLTWRGLEYVDLKPARPDGRFTTVYLVNDKSQLDDRSGVPSEPVTVNGRPGSLYRITATGDLAVRWQPAAGLWAELVEASGQQPARPPAIEPSRVDQLLAVAEAVRVDRVMRCVTPARLSYVPEGATYASCSIRFVDGESPTSQLLLRRADGAELTLHLPIEELPDEKPNLTVTGRPAYWQAGEPGSGHGSLVVYGYYAGEDIVVTVNGGFTRQDAIRLVEGLRLVGDLADPTTWPTDPLG